MGLCYAKALVQYYASAAIGPRPVSLASGACAMLGWRELEATHLDSNSAGSARLRATSWTTSQVASGLVTTGLPVFHALTPSTTCWKCFASGGVEQRDIHQRTCKAWPCRCPYENKLGGRRRDRVGAFP